MIAAPLAPADWWPVVVNFAMLLVWGGQVHQRVKALEAEIGALKALDSRMARVETRLDGLFEQFRELNASIRWMREPPPARARRRVTADTDG